MIWVVAAVKSRPVLHHCVVICFSPQWSCSVHVCCLHLKMEFCSCARGRQWCGIIHYHWCTASIKPRLLFSRAGYASWGLSLSSVYDDCFNDVKKSGVALTATRLCCYGCHFINVRWHSLIFGGLLHKLLILMFIIIVSLYFVKGKSYEHSLIIYWTSLV